MGNFFKNLFNKNSENKAEEIKVTTLPPQQVTEESLKRILNGAGPILNMLTGMFTTKAGFDISKALFYSAALTGYASHQAVKTYNPDLFVLVQTKNGATYYYGDAVNTYLFESQYNYLQFCNAAYNKVFPNEEIPEFKKAIEKVANNLGNDQYLVCDIYKQDYAYNMVKQCWNGSYDNMTAKYCVEPYEWPILFSIVNQNLMIKAFPVAPKETIYLNSIEIATFISKLDDNSFVK